MAASLPNGKDIAHACMDVREHFDCAGVVLVLIDKDGRVAVASQGDRVLALGAVRTEVVSLVASAMQRETVN